MEKTMLHLLRTTIVPWIAGMVVSLSSVAVGADALQPKVQTRIRKVIVMPQGDIAQQPVETQVIVQPQGIVDVQRREGYWQPGGYEGRVGSPYYYSVPGAQYGYSAYGAGSHGYGHHQPVDSGCECGRRGHHRSHHAHGGYGAGRGSHGHWRGSRRYDPYTYHFGPGYYRHAEHGHYRFPYYSYRRPWYYPGQPVFNRDTNFAW